MPSSLASTSLATANGVGVKNVQFAPSAQTLPRKIVIIGTYDETTKTGIVADQPYLVQSPEDVGDRFGFGFMVHTLAQGLYKGSGNLETWVVPQAEATTPGYAQGTITIVATSASAGPIYLYVVGYQLQISVADGDDETTIAAAIAAAINADVTLPVTATSALGVVTVDVKSAGPWGNFVNLAINLGRGEETPEGITSITIVQPTGGTGVPDIQTALDALGLNDDQNESYFTELMHGYLQDATTLDAISTWNGTGNLFEGNYAKLVARPLRSLNGDTAPGSSGLSSLITLGDGRKQDRTSGVVAVPGSPNHPAEIAAQALGWTARINNNRAAEHYTKIPLTGVLPGAIADRWTSSYSSRDTALKAGISPTKVLDGTTVVLQDVATFYHPDGVPTDSNGYAMQVNIAKLQNIMESVKVNFAQEKWQGIFIVQDVAKVTNTVDNQKARDITAVQNDVVALARAWEAHGWIATADFTIDEIKKGTYIQVRAGSTGFDITIPILLSGVGRIYNSEIHFDTSLAILTA
jgi:phage tail sheath gpL-like